MEVESVSLLPYKAPSFEPEYKTSSDFPFNRTIICIRCCIFELFYVQGSQCSNLLTVVVIPQKIAGNFVRKASAWDTGPEAGGHASRICLKALFVPAKRCFGPVRSASDICPFFKESELSRQTETGQAMNDDPGTGGGRPLPNILGKLLMGCFKRPTGRCFGEFSKPVSDRNSCQLFHECGCVIR
jgi:hypothetical protein